MFRLYCEDTREPDATAAVLKILDAYGITGATIYSALGVWRGTRERSLVIETTGNQDRVSDVDVTATRARIYSAAESIRQALQQDAVAVLESQEDLTLVTAERT